MHQTELEIEVYKGEPLPIDPEHSYVGEVIECYVSDGTPYNIVISGLFHLRGQFKPINKSGIQIGTLTLVTDKNADKDMGQTFLAKVRHISTEGVCHFKSEGAPLNDPTMVWTLRQHLRIRDSVGPDIMVGDSDAE